MKEEKMVEEEDIINLEELDFYTYLRLSIEEK